MRWKAKWIWAEDSDPHGYNQTAWMRKEFKLRSPGTATLSITADSWYRVWVNGEWIADGPCRSWPWKYQYDVLDVTPHLRKGDNEIRVLARYWGSGNFHQRPQMAGVLAQLDVKDGRRSVCIASDASWKAARCASLVSSVPKVAIQMEPYELWDGRLDDGEKWSSANVVASVKSGPWKNLTPRDVQLLTREPRYPVATGPVRLVDSRLKAYAFDAIRVLHPTLIEENASAGHPCAIATTMIVKNATRLRIETEGGSVHVDGRLVGERGISLKAGRHSLLVTGADPFNAFQKQKRLIFPDGHDGVTFEHLLKKSERCPWVLLRYPEADFAADDVYFILHPHPDRERIREAAKEHNEESVRASRKADQFEKAARELSVPFDPSTFVLDDPHQAFRLRRLLKGAPSVDNLSALRSNTAEAATINPDKRGDAEVHLDLGVQSVGYHDIEVMASEGTIIDIAQTEAVHDDGRVQTTIWNANSSRYICREGANRFLSTKRRSGRHVFITVRNAKGPVQLRRYALVESTYPVERRAYFRSSDSLLDQTWEISERTLKLCMEDTFTDCPLYEQTLWVGDARNEALYALSTFDARDISERCVRLAAESMEILPFVGCQVPSSWDCLLPAWSFLWGISIWDYYEHTGDKAFLLRYWPAVMQNIEGAASFRDEDGLFSGPFWNMFDWAGIDQNHETVIHNTLLLIGAIDAASKSAKVLGKTADTRKLAGLRRSLRTAVLKQYEQKKGVFPDSIHADGKLSKGRSIHTVMLAYLYDVLSSKEQSRAEKTLAKPPKSLTPVGSPFAIQYLFEAMDKAGLGSAIVDRMRVQYGAMLRRGATTVWETFEESGFEFDGFPTRSHCHAWSSAPLHFLPRIVLGIRPTQPGGAAFDISPEPCGLDWAEGAVCTGKGLLTVRWRKEGRQLTVEADAPAGVRLRLRPNPSHKNLRVKTKARLTRRITRNAQPPSTRET